MSQSTLLKLYEETVAVANALADEGPDRLVQLVELREAALNELQAGTDIGESERVIIREIMTYDGRIMKRMQELKDEASDRINKFQLSKMQKRVYDSDAFEGGSFFDKRK